MTSPLDLAAQRAALSAVATFLGASGASATAVSASQANMTSNPTSETNGGYIAYGRSFGGGSATGTFVDQLTVREDHRDEMVVTEHPVAIGPGPAPVSDHAYVRPAELTVECLWSNSSPASSGPTYARDVYARLLALRNERRLFSVYTGKRAYANMLMAGLDASTDESTEYALRATLHCRQMIVTSVQNFSITSNPANLSNPAAQQPPADGASAQTTSGGFTPAGVNVGTGPSTSAGGDLMQFQTQPGDGPSASAGGDLMQFSDDPSGTSYVNPVQVPVPQNDPGILQP